jgi:hypothetical protein
LLVQGGYVKIPPAYELGARLMAGQLTLDQPIEVRLLCPQPACQNLPEKGGFRLSQKYNRMT